ncbi:MAG: hypothetical protein PVI23_10260 [Maricaulaceae bacterium]|jgi:hypothetical protein
MTVQAANWMAGVLLPVLLAAGCAVDGLASSRTMAALDADAELWRSTAAGVIRYPAEPRGGEGVPFGYRVDYRLPTGAVVECTGRFGRYRCADGWRLAEQTF